MKSKLYNKLLICDSVMNELLDYILLNFIIKQYIQRLFTKCFESVET